MSDHTHDDGFFDHYWRIYTYLLVLFGISVSGPVVGELLSMPMITLITAFGIAFIKAWLVIKHFMHTPMEPRVVSYILITVLALMGLFVAAIAPDVMHHSGENWENVAAADAVKAGLAAGSGHHGTEPGDAGAHHDGNEDKEAHPDPEAHH